MGRTLNLASLPRDSAGQVDVAAVDGVLVEIAGSTPPMRSGHVGSEVLIERLDSLGSSEQPRTKPDEWAVSAPPTVSSIEHSPSPMQTSGIGRGGLTPVTTEELEQSLSHLAAAPIVLEAEVRVAGVDDASRAESSDIVLEEDVDLGSLPPLDAHGSVQSAPMEPNARPMSVPFELAVPSSPPSSSLVEFDVDSPVIPSSASTTSSLGHLPTARPHFSPLGSGSSSVPHASIPTVVSARVSEAAAAENFAAVGAVFDEFLGSAPVEPPPRSSPPHTVPRVVPGHLGGSLRAHSAPTPGFRTAPGADVSAPVVFGSDDEASEPLEMDGEVEMEEIEEMEEPLLSKSPPPLMARPPGPPPPPPRKR